jgi:uncharacterized protein (DUF1499 family)
MNSSPMKSSPAKSSSGQAVARVALYASSIVVLLGVSACAAGQSAPVAAPATFDPATGQFAPCPDSPNCVSTQATDQEHGIAPYTFSGSANEAMAGLLAVVSAMPRTTVVAQTDNYLHVEFRSRIFRFVDDVEFFVDDASKTVQFRSASRVGHSDLGVNRKRMEEIRTLFDTAQ